MKLHPLVPRGSVERVSQNLALVITSLAVAGGAGPDLRAAETARKSAEVKEAQAEIHPEGSKPPPLPLHQIEGNGGIFATSSAYLVNPPRNGEPLGRPALGFSFVDLGYGRELISLSATETPWQRLELGFAYENFNLGDLPQDILVATTVAITDQSVDMFNVNARLQILKEGEFKTKWIPALTFGVHYKDNTTIANINDELGGALDGIGITGHQGVDFTLYASKLFTFLPRPVLVELGGRATEGAETGLLGFTDSYSFLFEGNIVVFVTDWLALAAEYRQQPNDYQPIPGLINASGDWWTIDAAFVVSKHLTLAVGYGHFGEVLNHEANATWGVTTKYEF